LTGSAGKFPTYFCVFSNKFEKEYNIYSLQGSQSQKAKRSTLREILTPTNKGVSSPLLGFDTNQSKFYFEGSFPTHNITTFPVKNNVISTFPNYPAGCDDQFSEDAASQISSSLASCHVQ
jgi:hypothetical protein